MLSITTVLASFALAAPAGASQFAELEARLLKPGAIIPNATVTIPGGRPGKLHALLKGKKAAVINFWFFH
jgi:hypothetical protein